MKTAQETRVELLAALHQLSLLRPEWRLGQTLANLSTTVGRIDAGGIWDLEDEEALAAAKMLLAQAGEPESVVAGGASDPYVPFGEQAK